MATEKKKSEIKKLVKYIQEYPVIGLVDLHKMPSKQLQAIRKELRVNAKIIQAKKRLLERAIKETNKKNLGKLYEADAKKPALVFTTFNPFKLSKVLGENQSATYAKEKDVAISDIVIPEGPTKLPAGPAIGELQRAKIPAMVKEGKIHVSKETTVLRKGGVVTADIANLLKKLGIQPMKIGVNLVEVWEDGFIFNKEILAVSAEEYIQKLMEAHLQALNLAVNTEYPTKESIKILLQKAYLNAKNLGINKNILEKGVIEDLLRKAKMHGDMVQNKIGV